MQAFAERVAAVHGAKAPEVRNVTVHQKGEPATSTIANFAGVYDKPAQREARISDYGGGKNFFAADATFQEQGQVRRHDSRLW